MHTRRQLFGVAVLGLAALALLLAGNGRVQAGYMVTLLEQNSNVVATGSGTMDLTDLTFLSGGSGDINITASHAVVGVGPNADGSTVYTGFTGPSKFGSGGQIIANSGSGDDVLIIGKADELFVPFSYISGHSTSGSATWNNETFAGLGVTPGTYVWTWGTGAHADSFTLQVGPAATAAPEPASLTLLATGALGLLGYGWRRRRQAAA
jgi:hypothetical protein